MWVLSANKSVHKSFLANIKNNIELVRSNGLIHVAESDRLSLKSSDYLIEDIEKIQEILFYRPKEEKPKAKVQEPRLEPRPKPQPPSPKIEKKEPKDEDMDINDFKMLTRRG